MPQEAVGPEQVETYDYKGFTHTRLAKALDKAFEVNDMESLRHIGEYAYKRYMACADVQGPPPLKAIEFHKIYLEVELFSLHQTVEQSGQQG